MATPKPTEKELLEVGPVVIHPPSDLPISLRDGSQATPGSSTEHGGQHVSPGGCLFRNPLTLDYKRRELLFEQPFPGHGDESVGPWMGDHLPGLGSGNFRRVTTTPHRARSPDGGAQDVLRGRYYRGERHVPF